MYFGNSGHGVNNFKSTLMSSVLTPRSISGITCFAYQSTNLFFRKMLSSSIYGQVQKLEVIFQVWWNFFIKELVISSQPRNVVCYLPLEHIQYHQPILTRFIQTRFFTFQLRYHDFVKKLNWFFRITREFQVNTERKRFQKFEKWKTFTGLAPIN